jgi:hypothetical protein
LVVKCTNVRLTAFSHLLLFLTDLVVNNPSVNNWLISKCVSRVSCLLRIQFCRIAVFRIPTRPIEITNVNFTIVDRSAKLFSGHDQGIRRRKYYHTRPFCSSLSRFPVVFTLCSAASCRCRKVLILGRVAENWKFEILEWSGLGDQHTVACHSVV